MYEIYKAVTFGSCSSELALRNPGKISHARWFTTANSILGRLYIGTEIPSDNLKIISTYVVQVYVPRLISKEILFVLKEQAFYLI